MGLQMLTSRQFSFSFVKSSERFAAQTFFSGRPKAFTMVASVFHYDKPTSAVPRKRLEHAPHIKSQI